MPEIGATLREARMRARIDVSEIEAQTKIRARYLRALENEEWDLLPGPTFIKSFLRTYATALGLDGKALVEEYRVNFEHPGEQELQPISHQRRQARPGGDMGSAPSGAGPSRGYMVTVGLIGLLIVILVVGLLTRGSSPKKTAGSRHRAESRQTSNQRHSHPPRHSRTGLNAVGADEVSVSLQATAPVWVCLINGAQQKLIPGVALQAGQRSGPFHAKRFEITLGNASVSMTVNGAAVNVPASTSAIGYAIGPHGTTPLAAGRGPTCA
ncbi:MAG: helix-turn-helix domain-containing protein [Solirubrobacteraceae bacterium]